MSRGAIATNLILSGRVLSPSWLKSITAKGLVFFLSLDKIKKISFCYVRTGSNFYVPQVYLHYNGCCHYWKHWKGLRVMALTGRLLVTFFVQWIDKALQRDVHTSLFYDFYSGLGSLKLLKLFLSENLCFNTPS